MLRKFLVALVLLLPAALVPADEQDLQFDWAFMKQTPGGASHSVDFSERLAISTGDLFKISIKPLRNAYIYLYLQDAKGDLQLLFPEQFTDFEGARYMDEQFFVPHGRAWFTLDSEKGAERFHLLASASRLSRLESLTLAFQEAARGKNGADAQRQAVLDEITQLRRTHSRLTTAAEKPVTIAGGTRGAAIEGMRIEAAGFYTRTLRLEH
jgi:hypothetical protein